MGTMSELEVNLYIAGMEDTIADLTKRLARAEDNARHADAHRNEIILDMTAQAAEAQQRVAKYAAENKTYVNDRAKHAAEVTRLMNAYDDAMDEVQRLVAIAAAAQTKAERLTARVAELEVEPVGADALATAFVSGVAWWEQDQTGERMTAGVERAVHAEAARRYPDYAKLQAEVERLRDVVRRLLLGLDDHWMELQDGKTAVRLAHAALAADKEAT